MSYPERETSTCTVETLGMYSDHVLMLRRERIAVLPCGSDSFCVLPVRGSQLRLFAFVSEKDKSFGDGGKLPSLDMGLPNEGKDTSNVGIIDNYLLIHSTKQPEDKLTSFRLSLTGPDQHMQQNASQKVIVINEHSSCLLPKVDRSSRLVITTSALNRRGRFLLVLNGLFYYAIFIKEGKLTQVSRGKVRQIKLNPVYSPSGLRNLHCVKSHTSLWESRSNRLYRIGSEAVEGQSTSLDHLLTFAIKLYQN